MPIEELYQRLRMIAHNPVPADRRTQAREAINQCPPEFLRTDVIQQAVRALGVRL